MQATAETVTMSGLIGSVKRVIKAANLSRADSDRGLHVSAIDLTLSTVAVRTRGGRLDFQIPVVGMQVSAGRTVGRRDLHTIQLSLVAPDVDPGRELRDASVDEILLDAVETVQSVVADAAGGDDPFELASGTVDLTFVVMVDGVVRLGWSGDHSDEVTHTLRLHLGRTAPR